MRLNGFCLREGCCISFHCLTPAGYIPRKMASRPHRSRCETPSVPADTLPRCLLYNSISSGYARRVHNDMAKVAELSADLESLLLSDQADGGMEKLAPGHVLPDARADLPQAGIHPQGEPAGAGDGPGGGHGPVAAGRLRAARPSPMCASG